MKWGLLIWPVLTYASGLAFTPQHLLQLKQNTLDLFNHGYRLYLNHGFPADEVRPLTCEPYGPDYQNLENLRNDALGNVSLTVLDNLDTLIVMEQWDLLELALKDLKQRQEGYFDQDTSVQVFEASIRWLGGLLLAHILLVDVDWPEHSKMLHISQNYDGFLLVMAYDLGLRLIPAYKTSTQLPYPRINLRYGLKGVLPLLNVETCTSGAITPFLEFSLLSKLTGDPQFELHTSNTLWKLWLLRSQLGLMSMLIDPVNNKWLDEVTGIGASVDSFYEYALKGSIVFNDDSLWTVFSRLYRSLATHLAQGPGVDGYSFFANVNTNTGAVSLQWIDLLGAFWAGVQVLAGRLSDAVSSHLIYMKIWDYYDAIPERWTTLNLAGIRNYNTRLKESVPLEWYPLRPEFIESTYYLYRATRDVMYLEVGKRILQLFADRYKAPCGFAGVQDIRTGKFQNRMETFVLGELLKYLYLLFDEKDESYVHLEQFKNRNWVFSTEAHPLWYTPDLGKNSAASFQKHLLSLALEPISQPGTFETLWQKLKRSQSSMSETVQKQEVEVAKTSRFGPDFVPCHVELDVCEVKPRQFGRFGQFREPPMRFLNSQYFGWNKLFMPDAAFESTLIRPRHLQKYNESFLENYIELSSLFADTYGMAANFQCPRFPTTTEQEYVLGKFSRPENLEMFRMVRKNEYFPFAAEDLVMPLVSGRIKLELLKLGTVDTNNFKITPEYIRRKFQNEHVPKSADIFRVSKLNGFSVGKNRTVWADRQYLEQNSDTFGIARNDHVYLQGRYVENLKAFTGLN